MSLYRVIAYFCLSVGIVSLSFIVVVCGPCV